MEALQRAINMFHSRTRFAAALGVTHQAVQQWQTQGRVPVRPENRVLQIERLTGVSRHELAPDVYPD